MQVKIYLPADPAEQKNVLEELTKKYHEVRLSIDNGKAVAEVSEPVQKQLEIHPVTGLPVLLD